MKQLKRERLLFASIPLPSMFVSYLAAVKATEVGQNFLGGWFVIGSLAFLILAVVSVCALFCVQDAIQDKRKEKARARKGAKEKTQ